MPESDGPNWKVAAPFGVERVRRNPVALALPNTGRQLSRIVLAFSSVSVKAPPGFPLPVWADASWAKREMSTAEKASKQGIDRKRFVILHLTRQKRPHRGTVTANSRP